MACPEACPDEARDGTEEQSGWVQYVQCVTNVWIEAGAGYEGF